MKEFMMIFRNENNSGFKGSPEQMKENVKQWQGWIGNIVAQGKFVSTNRLGSQEKVLKSKGVLKDGPYMEVKKIISGYIIIQSNSIDEASKLANGCPILNVGGSVEIRDILQIPK